jgi:hypothetical protein
MFHSRRPDAIERIGGFLAQATESDVRRFLAGQLTLAFVEPNAVKRSIAGVSIEVAYTSLAELKPPELRRYFSPPSLVSPSPKAPSSKSAKALIDAILLCEFGRTYLPPPKQRATSKRAATTAKPKATSRPFDATAWVSRLNAMETAAEGREALSTLGRNRKAPYQAIAEELKIHFNKNDKIDHLVDQIVRLTIEARREHSTLQRLGQR